MRGEVWLTPGAVYLRSRALARELRLERGRWLRIGIKGTVQEKGVDFRPVAELINATSALRRLRTARGEIERVGEESVRGRSTTHYRTHVSRGNPRRPMPATADVWVDENGFVRRIEERYRWGPPRVGPRGHQRVEFLAFGLPVEGRTPAPGGAREEPPRESDRRSRGREQVEALVLGFFQDVAHDDLPAACGKLSPAGRGVAVATVTYPGRPIPPATTEQCVKHGIRGVGNSSTFRFVLEGGGLRISSVHVAGRRARVVVSAGAIDGVQRLSKTSQGWKIDRYENPVRD